MSREISFASLAAPNAAWGPSDDVPQLLRFSDVPYAPFSKSDKLGKAADWNVDQAKEKEKTKQLYQRGQKDQYHAYGVYAASSFAAETADDREFSVVDKNATAASSTTTVLRGRLSRNQQRKPNTMASKLAGSGGYSNNNNKQSKPQYGNKQGNQNQQRRPYQTWGNKYDDKQRTREPSIKVKEGWTIVSEFEFSQLTKLTLEVGPGETVTSYGSLYPYNKKYERLNGSEAPLSIIDRNFYNPTASEDPVIQELASEQSGVTVYSTDKVVSQLMCATRSVYSWDIVVTKKGDKIFLDKREGSILDRITVDENSSSAPSDSLDSDINNASKLSLEAVFINSNYVASSINEGGAKRAFEHKSNPFVDEGEEDGPLLPRGYRYRKFMLPSSNPDEELLPIVIRTEVDAYDPSNNQLLSINTLNQYSPGTLDWKTKLNQQRGAILAAEMKKNNNKISKWSTEAILADIDTMKIGFVTRVNPKDNSKHVVVGDAQFKSTELAAQMNLSVSNGWGIVRSIINMIEPYSDSENEKFVILKDPNSPKVTIYKVPDNSSLDTADSN